MRAYEIYRQIRDKADEVKDAINAIAALRGSRDRWDSPDDLLEYFKIYSRLSVETEIEKDARRSVRVLHEYYCRVRDELLKLLQSDIQYTQKPNGT